jgi:peptide/nickel transport system ATP-binding protein
MAALLEVRDIARHYRVRRGDGWWRKPATLKAVDGISFRIERGKTLGLVGESGCGKSTAARLALGLLPATSGEALFEGAKLATRARLQLVFQDTLGSLDRRLPVGRQIMEPLEIHGIGDPAERTERARELFAAVGLLPHLFERYPHELSGGQRQRVVLARALIAGPALIACDEPISALDVSIQAQVINLLQELRERFGVAYLFISHDLKVVRQISDEVAVMYLGRIVEQGNPERVFREPAHPYAQALVSAIPSIRRTRQRTILPGDPPSPVDVPRGCAFHPRCPMAMAKCRVETPMLSTLPDGHRVACHLAGTAGDPPPTDEPAVRRRSQEEAA